MLTASNVSAPTTHACCTQDVMPNDPPTPPPADLTVYPSDTEMVADWTSGQQRAMQLAWQLRMRPAPLMGSAASSPPANISAHVWYAQPWVEEQEALANMSAATAAETEDTAHLTASAALAASAASAAHTSTQVAPTRQTSRCVRLCDAPCVRACVTRMHVRDARMALCMLHIVCVVTYHNRASP